MIEKSYWLVEKIENPKRNYREGSKMQTNNLEIDKDNIYIYKKKQQQ